MRILKVIGDFAIGIDRDGPVAIRKIDDQYSFDFADKDELPDEVLEMLISLGEEQHDVWLKALSDKRVDIFSLDSVKMALRQTGAVSFADEHRGSEANSRTINKYDVGNAPLPTEYLEDVLPTALSCAASNPPDPAYVLESWWPARKNPQTEKDDGNGAARRPSAKVDHESEITVAFAYRAMMRSRAEKLSRPRIVTDSENLSSDEAIRVQRLKQIYEDERGTERRLIMADDEMIRRIEAVQTVAPQFEALIGVYVRAATLSAQTGAVFHVPPMVLVGPPGTGKSYAAQRLAEAIHGWTDFHRLSMNLVTDSGMLFGHEQSWRGSKPGLLTTALIESRTACPVFYLDEIDKLQSTSSAGEDPFLPLLTLLERENAAAAKDNYLGIEFDMSHALIIATANDISTLSEPIRDRLIVIETRPPTREQRLVIARSMIDKTAKAYRTRFKEPDEVFLESLSRHHPRRISRLIVLALGFMATAGRGTLTIDDLEAATRLLANSVKPSIGFIAAVD